MRTAVVTLLLALGMAAPAQAYRLEHTRWYSHTITFYTAASRYKQAAAAAARAWNTSGAHVRWKAVSRRRARVVITTSTRIPGAGQARFRSFGGIVRRASIRLLPDVANGFTSPVAARAVETGAIAHEMGHVLGLAHEQRRCTTMNAALWEKCPAPPNPWQTRCRPLTADDIRGVVRLYGGKVRKRLPAQYCDMEPAPAAPAGLTATLTPGGDAHLAWTMPAAPAKQYVRVIRRKDTCPVSSNDPAATVLEQLQATPGAPLTLDDPLPEQGHYCYAVIALGTFQRPSPLATAPFDTPVGEPPDPDFGAAADPANHLEIHYSDITTDPDGRVVAWSWDFGDGATSTEQNPTHTYASAGTYRVTLTVTDDGRNTRSIVHPVRVS
jgi:chitodextrinase